jgi:hypothetical protein
MWRYFVWMINQLALTFATNLVFDVKSKLKGKPVKIRRYPRSCKLCKLFVLQATVLLLTGRQQSGSKPEDLPGSSTIIQSFRVKGMECKSCKAFIFLYAVVGNPEHVEGHQTHFSRKQSQKNFFKHEKENFYCGCCFIQQSVVRTERQCKKFK